MKDLSLEQMEKVEGGWESCALFFGGFVLALVSGPAGAFGGLLMMATNAGGCERELGW